MSGIGKATELLDAARALALAGLAMLATSVFAGPDAPANDSFSNAFAISGATNFITTTNIVATSEPGEPAHAGEPPTHSLWWRWTVPFTGSFTVNTRDSSFDTVLGVYQGTALANLTVIATNDDKALFSDKWSEVVFRAHAGENFYIAVDGVEGAKGIVRLAVGPAGSYVPWQATNLAGQVVRSTDFANKVVLLDFWETTCGACVTELPDLVKLQNSLGPQGFSIVGLSGDPSPQLVIDYLTNRSIPYPIGMSNPDVEHALDGPLGFPTKYLIDREGKVVGRFLGGGTLEFYNSIVRPMLRSAPSVTAQVWRQGTNMNISWPGTEFGYVVEARTNLLSGSWIPVSAPEQMIGGQRSVTVAVSGERQFFRLRKP